MIYRAKVGLQNSKQLIGYSPSHSPSNRKKTSTIKQNKYSPKPSQRENKQNIDQKQLKTQRLKEQKYFKFPKEGPISSSKKSRQNCKINIFLNIHDKQQNIQQLNDLKFLNIQTPKFKCSSNKIDDRCKTDHTNNHQNYFSFGEDFSQNMSTFKRTNIDHQKRQIINISSKSKNGQQQNYPLKLALNSLKKKQKVDKMKQVQDKLQIRFLQIEKQIKQGQYKRDRQVFCFKK